MNKSTFGKWLVIGTLVVAVVAVGVMGVGVVAVAAQGPGDGGGGFFRGMMGRWGGRDSSYLADELGITTEELSAARQAAQEAALAEAVEAGELSQDEADLLLARHALSDYTDSRALMAQVLGVSVEELGEKPMHTWIEEQGLDTQTFHDQMQEARAEAIAEAVADGVITQAQADALLETGWGPMMRGGRQGGTMWQGGGQRGALRGNRGALRGSGDCPMLGDTDS